MNPKEKNRIIEQALKQGRKTPGIAAYQGASFEFIKGLFEKGYQRAVMYADSANPNGIFDVLDPLSHNCELQNGFSIFPISGRTDPNQDQIINEASRHDSSVFYDACAEAMVYARADYFKEKTGIEVFTREDASFLLHSYNKPFYAKDLVKFAKEKESKISVDESKKIIRESFRREGFVIGYSKDVFKQCKPLPHNSREPEYVKLMKTNIDSVAGIEPLGEKAEDAIYNLIGFD